MRFQSSLSVWTSHVWSRSSSIHFFSFFLFCFLFTFGCLLFYWLIQDLDRNNMVCHSWHLCTTLSSCAFGREAPVPFLPACSREKKERNIQVLRNILVPRETYKRASAAAASGLDLRGRVAAGGACVLAGWKEPAMPPPSPQISPRLLCNCL